MPTQNKVHIYQFLPSSNHQCCSALPPPAQVLGCLGNQGIRSQSFYIYIHDNISEISIFFKKGRHYFVCVAGKHRYMAVQTQVLISTRFLTCLALINSYDDNDPGHLYLAVWLIVTFLPSGGFTPTSQVWRLKTSYSRVEQTEAFWPGPVKVTLETSPSQYGK